MVTPNYRLLASEALKLKIKEVHPNVKISNISFKLDKETKDMIESKRKEIREILISEEE